jgi:hypothetical protein
MITRRLWVLLALWGGIVPGPELRAQDSRLRISDVRVVEGSEGATAAVVTVTLERSSPGTTTYTPAAYLPAHSDGVPTSVQWIHGATLVVKDNVGGDLVAFFRGTNGLHAAVSRDDGLTWSWVDPSSNVDVDPTLAIAQSADGDVHIIAWSWWRGASYSRLTLSRDGAHHISGFASPVSNIAFPSDPYPGDMSADIVAGTDQAGNPTLFFVLYDRFSDSIQGRIVAGKTTVAAGTRPSASSHFVALEGTAGWTQLETMGSDGWAAPHNACVLMAQHPVSKDLWFQWGPLNTGDGLTQNTLPVKRLRAVPGGANTFVPGVASTVAVYADGWGTQNYAVVSSPSSVWFAYGMAASALNFDKASADGTITKNAIPSPYPVTHSGGFFTMAVNSTETAMWLAGMIAYETGDPGSVPEDTWAKYWNGSSWTTFDATTIPDGTNFRLSRSSGWDRGLVFLQSRFDYESWRPALGTLRTLP